LIPPFEHPYYWSAFILIGDPGEVKTEPTRPPAEPMPILLPLVLALTGLALVQIVRTRAGRVA
jgi:hypothetical protein